MSQTVLIPANFRRFTGGAEVVELEAGTVGEVIDRLDARFPGIRARLCETSGELRRVINIYVDGSDVRLLKNLATPVRDGTEIAIVPVTAAG